jgi:hypothetical protein
LDSAGFLPPERRDNLDARIPKLRTEAARLKTRIENLTARYDATVEKITELENLEIVGLVRAENMSIEQLAALIKGGVPDED